MQRAARRSLTPEQRSKRLLRGTLALGLSYLVSACSMAYKAPTTQTIIADEALAVQSRVTDCEWKAANQYDDGQRAISDLAKQVMGVCAVELLKARQAFGFSPNDASIEPMEFEQAVKSVEGARKARPK